jgi:hypothetical protein
MSLVSCLIFGDNSRLSDDSIKEARAKRRAAQYLHDSLPYYTVNSQGQIVQKDR